MTKVESDKKKTAYVAAFVIFILGILVGTTAPLLKMRARLLPLSASGAPQAEDKKTATSHNEQAATESCAAEQDQRQDNDALFIGCNGFF